MMHMASASSHEASRCALPDILLLEKWPGNRQESVSMGFADARPRISAQHYSCNLLDELRLMEHAKLQEGACLHV